MEEAHRQFIEADLARLRNVGVTTLYLQAAINWNHIESAPGIYHWGILDRYVERIHKYDLKALIPVFYSSPTWKPDDWYLEKESKDDIYQEPAWTPNYRSIITRLDIYDFINKLQKRYNGWKVQFIFSIPLDGEFPFPVPLKRCSDEILANFVVGAQIEFAKSYNEAWFPQHFWGLPSYMDAIYKMCHETPEVMDAEFYGIQFTHFPHGETHQVGAVAKATQDWGVKYFVGSEYIGGLKTNWEAFQRQQLHGLLTAPIHRYTGKTHLEPEDIEIIRETIKKLGGQHG
jgi:hypothetical protein